MLIVSIDDDDANECGFRKCRFGICYEIIPRIAFAAAVLPLPLILNAGLHTFSQEIVSVWNI
jgi:hypothetical protein